MGQGRGVCSSAVCSMFRTLLTHPRYYKGTKGIADSGFAFGVFAVLKGLYL